MSFDDFLTFIGIIIATLALIPRARILFIRVKLNLFDFLIVSLCFLTIVYLLFYKSFLVFGLTPGWNLHRWQITPSNSIFIILLFLTSYLFFRIRYFSFAIRKVPKVGRLIDNLLQEKKYNDLIDFLENNYDRLNKISHKKTRYLILRERAKKRGYSFEDLLLERQRTSKYHKFINILSVPLRVFPQYEDYISNASIVLSKVVLNEYFLEHIIKTHSYIFLKFFECEKYYRDDFVDLIFKKLLSDNKSILYIELENTQNIHHYSNYLIVETNRLVYFLFNNPKTAEELHVWTPIGEYVIERLDYLRRRPKVDNYNTNIQNFSASLSGSQIFFSGYIFLM